MTAQNTSKQVEMSFFQTSCNILWPAIFIAKETKDINDKAFNMITNKNEAKAWKNVMN